MVHVDLRTKRGKDRSLLTAKHISEHVLVSRRTSMMPCGLQWKQSANQRLRIQRQLSVRIYTERSMNKGERIATAIWASLSG